MEKFDTLEQVQELFKKVNGLGEENNFFVFSYN